jgi:hypothetical protein
MKPSLRSLTPVRTQRGAMVSKSMVGGACIRAAERAGYEREGLLRSHQEISGERCDMLLYAAIRGRAKSAEGSAIGSSQMSGRRSSTGDARPFTAEGITRNAAAILGTSDSVGRSNTCIRGFVHVSTFGFA